MHAAAATAHNLISFSGVLLGRLLGNREAPIPRSSRPIKRASGSHGNDMFLRAGGEQQQKSRQRIPWWRQKRICLTLFSGPLTQSPGGWWLLFAYK